MNEIRMQADAASGQLWSERNGAPLGVTPVVFVIDDDACVRQSLESLINAAGWRAETFSCAHQFVARPRVQAPACLILAAALPGLDCLELQKRIAAERTDLPVIFIAAFADVPTTVRAMKGGALEFFLKPLREDVLLNAIGHALERSQAALAEEAQIKVLRDGHVSLTGREREVMALVVSGLLNKQVADVLGISEITVKAHRGNVMRKMNADSFASLVSMATRLGFGPGQSGLCRSRPKSA